MRSALDPPRRVAKACLLRPQLSRAGAEKNARCTQTPDWEKIFRAPQITRKIKHMEGNGGIFDLRQRTGVCARPPCHEM